MASLSRKLVFACLAALLITGCMQNPVSIIYDPAKPMTFLRNLRVLDPNWDGKIQPLLKDVQCKLINPRPMTSSEGKVSQVAGACVVSFFSDSQIHLGYPLRVNAPGKIFAIVSGCFPEYKSELQDSQDFQAEKIAPTEDRGVFITRTEEIWLLYNKDNRHYFLYQNAEPEAADCVKDFERADAKPWD